MEDIELKNLRIVGLLSTNDGVEFRKTTKLQYLKLPEIGDYPLDLNKGIGNYRHPRPEFNSEGFLKIEKFIMENGFKADDVPNSDSKETTTKIVTQRNLMSEIMKIKYTKDFCTEFLATKYQGVIYLKSKPFEFIQSQNAQSTHHFKFNQYCFSDSPNSKPNTDRPVDENEKTYAIYQAQLKKFDILYSAEIFGIISDQEIKDVSDMSELNSCRFVNIKLMRNNTKTKLFEKPRFLEVWVKADLSKAVDIYYAIKEQDGLISSPVQHVKTQDLSKHSWWDLKSGYTFLHKCLNDVDKTMSHVNCPYTVYEFSCKSKTINYEICEGKTEKSFLSEEFIEKLQKV